MIYLYFKNQNLENSNEDLFYQIIKAFQLDQNLKTLFIHKPGSLDYFYGIRALCVGSVIFYHTTIFNNISERKLMTVLISYLGTYAVDIFFFIGGFFVSFVMLKQNNE